MSHSGRDQEEDKSKCLSWTTASWPNPYSTYPNCKATPTDYRLYKNDSCCDACDVCLVGYYTHTVNGCQKRDVFHCPA